MARFCVWAIVFSVTTLTWGEDFSSDFTGTRDRVWPGAEYWANPMEDWSIEKGKLVCRGGGNRNVALLTREIQSDGNLNMSVQINADVLAADGTIGFRIGIQDEVDDYRAAALRGKGLDLGIDSKAKTLFIGKVTGAPIAETEFPKSPTLRLAAEPAGNRFSLNLSLIGDGNQELASVETSVPAEKVTGLAALAINHGTKNGPGCSFSNWKLSGSAVVSQPDRAWGPILWTMHTVNKTFTEAGTVLKVTAQLAPDGGEGSQSATLSFEGRDRLYRAKVDRLSCTATFRVPNWDSTKPSQYVVRYGDQQYSGTIRKEPSDRPLVVAGFTGNQDYLFPNRAVVRNVTAQNPDILFFSGDQIYEGVGGYGIVRAPTDTADDATIRRATLNYLRKWYLLGWAFGDLMRDRPTICLPDDHDVYQGNIWGEGGLNPHGIRNHARGGFAEHPTFVNAVFHTQCNHHPDLPDPATMEQEIKVLHCSMLYGRVSFAIIADRYFKSGPEGKVNSWNGRPDHMKDPKYDVGLLDKPGLSLLGERQESFLDTWVQDWRSTDFKCVLSQTIFCNLANYHGGNRMFILADLDSNGWPQTGRKNALRIMRKGYAFHYAGDQHLPSITQNGIDTWGDAGFAFCVPSIAAGYPRSWLPDKEGRTVQNRPEPGLPNTGEYRDGFGNFVTVFGIGNPAEKNRPGRENTAHDKSSGHGIVRFQPEDLTISIECYRVQIDPLNIQPRDQFPGWPKMIRLHNNRGQAPTAYLPSITAPPGIERPVLSVSNAETDDLIYIVRLNQRTVRPWIYDKGSFNVKLGDPDTDNWSLLENVRPEQ